MYHSGAYRFVVVLSIAYTFAFPCAVSALSLIKNKNNGKRIMVSSTRKSTRLSSKAVAVLPESTAPSPAKKESVTKAASTATKSKKKKETVAVIAKAKKAVAKKVVAPTAVKKAAAAVVGSEGKKIVIIEACKQ